MRYEHREDYKDLGREIFEVITPGGRVASALERRKEWAWQLVGARVVCTDVHVDSFGFFREPNHDLLVRSALAEGCNVARFNPDTDGGPSVRLGFWIGGLLVRCVGGGEFPGVLLDENETAEEYIARAQRDGVWRYLPNCERVWIPPAQIEAIHVGAPPPRNDHRE